MMRWIGAAFAFAFALGIGQAGAKSAETPPFPWASGGKILFLGDSNTYAGLFVAYVDAYLAGRFPDRKFELVNIGLPSETVTGLTEETHPFPRPDVHERAQRALDKFKPNFVVVCYGMNDGIYHPFSEERFAKYKEATLSLVAKIRKAGAQPILMTPCPFDPLPLKGKTLPESAGKFDYSKPFAGYDDVLTKYSAWLVSQRSKDLPVADPHAAILAFLAEVRKTEPNYFISGDGIHPNPTGHAIVALTLLEALHAPRDVAETRLADGTTSTKQTAKIPLAVSATWHPHLGSRWDFAGRINGWPAKAAPPEGPKFAVLIDGTQAFATTKAELAKGIVLDPLRSQAVRKRAEEALTLILERERLLRHAWLTEVGHKRPGIAAGQPLEKLQPTLADLDRRIREATRPIETAVTLEATEK